MLRFLSSLRLFYGLCGLLAASFVYQTLFNRGESVYGTAGFAALGLALAGNIAACTARRMRTAPWHFTMLHVGVIVVIAGAFLTRYTRFEAELPLRAGQTSDSVYTPEAVFRLPFAVTLDEFRLEYYAEPRGWMTVEEGGRMVRVEAHPGAELKTKSGATLAVLQVRRDFGMNARHEVVDKSAFWLNPAIQVCVKDSSGPRTFWVFSRFAGHAVPNLPFRVAYTVEGADVRDFTSRVTLKSAAGTEARGEIRVNHPLHFSGYTLYQTSYDPADVGYTLLTVTRVRGLWVVYVGFVALLLGVGGTLK